MSELEKILSLTIKFADENGLNANMYSQCPKCGYPTFHIMDCYGFQEIKECECGCKYVLKYKKGKEWRK